jgi:hypothetical protein
MPTSRSYARTTSPVDAAPLEREAPIRIVAEPRTTTLPAPIYEPAIPDPAVPPAPVERRLPVHRNKAERVTEHLAGLSEDLREWVELRIRLVKAEVETLIDSRVGAMRGLLVFGVTASITGLFALVTLAIGLGALFGGRYWLGFLLVNLVLLIVTLVVKRKFAPGKLRMERSKATGTLKVSHEKTPAQNEAEKKGKPVPDQGELKPSVSPK